MSKSRTTALFGGTFDPVHKGHIDPLTELANQFGWTEVQLLPTFQPPYRKQPVANDQQRVAMLKLATADDPRFTINTWEIDHCRPSRTRNILLAIKEENPETTICFVVGMDSFVSLDSWLEWQSLFKHCHFVVLPRPGYTLDQMSSALEQFCLSRYSDHIEKFNYGQGLIYLADTQPVNCASTELRKILSSATECPQFLTPQVWQYIQQQGLYR